MTVTARKYNPGFLSDDELVASFCVRTDEFESMMEPLREAPGDSNAHQIVIGPRGSGKTSLLLRIAAEIRRDARLSTRLFPVVFAEESYEVSTAGEFWLEALSRLADQAPNGEDGPDLHRTFEELRQIRDDRMLGDRCLGIIQDFSDREGKRLVLMVENLNMLFRDIADRDAGWRLRQTLQTEPRILLLASATSRFDEMEDRNKALYDLFRTVALRPLDVEDCAILWQTVSGQERAPETIRALRILTGGSPRLLTIVARFGAALSFRELMADLLDLVDDHTEYFKSHLDALPAQERRVYLALAELWKPATAREIADRARLDTSKCSAQLARLAERGAVEVTGGTARRKLYYLAERLYNIYYLTRRARGPAPMIEALIRFMEGYYSVDEWREFVARMAGEVPGLDDETLGHCRIAFLQLLRLPALEAYRDELLSLARATFADWTDHQSVESASSLPSLATALVGKALELADRGQLEDAIDALDEVIQRLDANGAPEAVAMALCGKVGFLSELNRLEEALATCDEALHRFAKNDAPEYLPGVAAALANKGVVLLALNRAEEALAVWEEVERRFGRTKSPMVRDWLKTALLGKANMELANGQARKAIATVDRLFGEGGAGLPENEWRAYMIRAWACLAEGDVDACAKDTHATLSIIPALGSLPKEVLDDLSAMAVALGPEKMRGLIRASPAADLLLPLTTALELELGLEPRVAKEVEEVAQDIRRDLEERRKARQG